MKGMAGKFGDLKRRLLFLLLALIVYRIGAHIPVPGDPLLCLCDGFEHAKIQRIVFCCTVQADMRHLVVNAEKHGL